MQRHLAETDQIKSDPVVQHPLCRQPQELLVDLVERRPSREDNHFEPGSVKVPINPVFFERVEREICRFEDGRFVSTRKPSGELFGTVFSGS